MRTLYLRPRHIVAGTLLICVLASIGVFLFTQSGDEKAESRLLTGLTAFQTLSLPGHKRAVEPDSDNPPIEPVYPIDTEPQQRSPSILDLIDETPKFAAPVFLGERISKVLRWLPFSELEGALPACEAVLDHIKQPFVAGEGGSRMRHSQVYPPDNTAIMDSSNTVSQSNDVIPEDQVNTVVQHYLTTLNAQPKHKSNPFALERIVRVIHRGSPSKADYRKITRRYLLDLEVRRSAKVLERIVVYVAQLGNDSVGSFTNGLCYPNNFNLIADNTTVYIMIAVKDRADWVKHVVANIEALMQQNVDKNIRLVLTDFSSQDVNVEAVLTKSNLKDPILITEKGVFQRAWGLQAAANAVTDPNGILLQSSLHMQLPLQLIEDVRMLVVPGYQVYAPMLVRLEETASFVKPIGKWEFGSFSIIGITKKDFVRIGGMNYQKFAVQWGGEDWDFMDRILAGKLDTERKRQPHLLHMFHTKAKQF